MKRISVVAWLVGLLCLCSAPPASEVVDADLPPAKRSALDFIDSQRNTFAELNRKIWSYAEVGLQEHRSAAEIVHLLRQHGFDVKTGVAGMPTAFVASYGSGSPVIGILAEYDALPGLSQTVAPERKPVVEGGAGHACGHSALGAAATAAAIAVRYAMEAHGLRGTIRLYGTPAEETGIGKFYMLRAGLFDDLDVCFHWHPSTRNHVLYTSSKAIASIKFTFRGTPAHASTSPHNGRSALDGVELMNVGVNYMREHVKEDARIHYVITDGGGQPNVVPPRAQVWYYVRADRHEDMEAYARWVMDIARAAAMMSRTSVEIEIITDNHELIPNRPLSEVVYANFQLVGPPEFTSDEKAFAAKLQEPLKQLNSGSVPDKPLEEGLEPLPDKPDRMKGSTDVGDISWFVPTSGVGVVCFVAGAPGHSWQNVASVGSTIGEKGLIVAAKVLALSAIDVLLDPTIATKAKEDLKERLKAREYRTLVPEDRVAPTAIR